MGRTRCELACDLPDETAICLHDRVQITRPDLTNLQIVDDIIQTSLAWTDDTPTSRLIAVRRTLISSFE